MFCPMMLQSGSGYFGSAARGFDSQMSQLEIRVRG
jgi:hypothetical protein